MVDKLKIPRRKPNVDSGIDNDYNRWEKLLFFIFIGLALSFWAIVELMK